MNQKIWTALVTPFDEKGKVDFDSLRGLIKHQEGNGIFLLGSTGEGLSLTLKEKKQILEFVCDLKPSSPLLVGVGGFQLEEQLEWMRFCEKYPIEGFVLVAPIYTRPGKLGQKRWFEKLLQGTKKPCMIYNTSRSGALLHAEGILSLQEKNFWAIKEASGEKEIFAHYGKDFPGVMYSGCDDLIEELIEDGLQGVVSVMSNVWPKLVREIVEEIFQKDSHRLPLLNQLASISNRCNPVAAKKLLFYKGWIQSPYVRPPLCLEDVVFSDEEKELGKRL